MESRESPQRPPRERHPRRGRKGPHPVSKPAAHRLVGSWLSAGRFTRNLRHRRRRDCAGRRGRRGR
eukprot:10548071-Alexandrium_andersonii.AAC.1